MNNFWIPQCHIFFQSINDVFTPYLLKCTNWYFSLSKSDYFIMWFMLALTKLSETASNFRLLIWLFCFNDSILCASCYFFILFLTYFIIFDDVLFNYSPRFGGCYRPQNNVKLHHILHALARNSVALVDLSKLCFVNCFTINRLFLLSFLFV